MTLLETLRALAPVVTPGEWLGYSEPDVGLPYSLFTREPSGSLSELQYQLSAVDIDVICLLRNNLPTIIAALEAAALVRDEDWLEDRISDSLDVDWRPIDAARSVIAALPKETDNAHD